MNIRMRPLALMAALVLVLVGCGQKAGVEFTAGDAPAGGQAAGGNTTRTTQRPGAGGGTATTKAGGSGGGTATTAAGGSGGGTATTAAGGGGGGVVTPGPGGAGGGGTTAGGGGTDPSTGGGVGGPTDTTVGGGPTDTTAGGGGPTDTTAAGGGGGGGTAPPPPGPAAPPPPGNRTGISDTKIKIGIHAPVTGAAPIRQDTFDKGKRIYWDFLKATAGGVFGKEVEVSFRDDEFNPQRARDVCQEMVEVDKVFMLIGAAGADQITACANYAAEAGVPYLSAGVNEEGLVGVSTYFGISMTYSQQSALLVQLVQNRIQKQRIGIVVLDTPSFADAQGSFTAAAQDAGLQIVVNKKLSKTAGTTEALAAANELKSQGAEVVYVLLSPTVFLNLAQQAGGQQYFPQYIGPGVSNGLNTVASLGCPGVGTAMFLSPFPQLDVIDQIDPDYKAAYRTYGGGEGDDIGLALWGLNKTLNTMFQAAGPDMSRESFIQTLTSGQQFSSGIYPPATFSPDDRFGADSAHLLQADCGARPPVYKTVATFASSF